MIVGVLAGFVLVYVFTTIRIRQLLEDAEDQWDVAPDLRRNTLAEARNKISATGLRLKVPDGAPDDAIVVQQSTEPGAPVHVGSQIEVSVAGSADAGEARAGASGSGHRAANGVGRIPRQ
jgi:beta-lactam-binding protein with PASTA domain